MAKICAILARRRHEKVVEEMAEAAKLGLSMIELRLDFLQHSPRVEELLRRRPCETIATVRRQQDGGMWSGSEEKRRTLLRSAIAAGVDWVDLESDVAAQFPRYGRTKRLVSHHVMDGMPDDLDGLWEKMAALDADAIKICGRAANGRDALKMVRLAGRGGKPTIAVAMGEWGAASRVLGVKFGSPWTYAAFNPLRRVAPGLLTVEELRDIFHVEKVGPATKVFGVLGDPVSHSLSPLVHNACFRKVGFDGVYVPFRVKREEFQDFVKDLDGLDVGGLSVTIPHKEAASRRGEAGDAIVQAASAANTMLAGPNGWRLFNTDAAAAVDAIEALIPPDPETGFRSLADRAALVLGAGGVARGVAAGLLERGATVTVCSRRAEEATNLAHRLKCLALDWEERYNKRFDVVVNGTPVGMAPNFNDTAYHQSALQPGMVILETVYTPENTLLVREARGRGAAVATGVDMFVRQAEAQFQLFAGQSAPAGLMRQILQEEMSPAKAMLKEQRQTEG